MNNTAENEFFGFPKVKWLQCTDKVGKCTSYRCQIFSEFTHQKSLKSVIFWQTYWKNKKVGAHISHRLGTGVTMNEYIQKHCILRRPESGVMLHSTALDNHQLLFRHSVHVSLYIHRSNCSLDKTDYSCKPYVLRKTYLSRVNFVVVTTFIAQYTFLNFCVVHVFILCWHLV